MIPNCRPFRSISYRFWDNNFFWKNRQFWQISQYFEKLYNFQSIMLLHIITLVIPNFHLFRSICHRFWDTSFFRYYDPCDLKFRPFHPISYSFRDKNFFCKNGKITNFGKFTKKMVVLHILTLVSPNLHPFCSISYRFPR